MANVNVYILLSVLDVWIMPVVCVFLKIISHVLEHGLSVGPRYDLDSSFFNKKCICDEDWAGDLCNIPITDQVLI